MQSSVEAEIGVKVHVVLEVRVEPGNVIGNDFFDDTADSDTQFVGDEILVRCDAGGEFLLRFREMYQKSDKMSIIKRRLRTRQMMQP